MFNNYYAGNTTNTLKINSCSGGIYKTYKESWFKRFHLKSTLSDILLKKSKCFYSDYYDEYNGNGYKSGGFGNDGDFKEVIILQMVICGDMEVIAELITKEDFDKNFLSEKGEKEDE